jgi:trehalose 6-phosphate phosphatase
MPGVAPDKSTDTLPSALACFAELSRRLQDRRPAVFLDYDGTLTLIVDRPEAALISEPMRCTVRELARHCTVAIVSGRDRKDVERLAGIEGIYYAGSHGFDIAGPAGKQLEFQQGRDYLPALDRAETDLRRHLEAVPGAQVERKRFAIAVHFRRVAKEKWPQVEAAVAAVLTRTTELRRTGGKMIFELRPDIDWDKGKALAWLLEQLGLDRREVVPVYLGDDLTDEDALREIEGDGIGILVRDEVRPTHAGYVLEDPGEVRTFLERLAAYLREREPS